MDHYAQSMGLTFLRLRTHHAQTQYLQGFERIEVNVDIF